MKLLENPAALFAVYIAALSLITFFAYGIDKLKAKNGAWRISERALLGLGFIGGAIGGILGMKTFRHKTKHRYFWAINFMSLGVHIAVIAALIHVGV